MTETRNKDDEREPRWFCISLGTAVGVIVIFVLITWIQYGVVEDYIAEHENVDVDVSVFGLSGDFFGLANALFSALAFAMIIVTLWMQKYELKQQREELEDTRKVMKDQHEEMEQQNASLQRQTFENTFFNMLEMHNEIVQAIRIHGNRATGRLLFADLLNSLQMSANRRAGDTDSTAGTKTKETISIKVYEELYEENEARVGHYSRTLYNMMRYIDEQGGEHRMTYARLVRAQLSSNELMLLYYNGLGKYGREKFKPLIEKHALLKHLRDSPGHLSAEHRYADSAFGNTK